MAIPYYRWFPGDYARDTRHLSLMQHGAYRLLLDLYMDSGGPLRNDLGYLHRWLHAESVEEKQAVEFILADFFVLTDLGWTHKRCDSELKWRNAKSEDAKKAIGIRWQKSKLSTDTDVQRTNNERYTNQNQNYITPPTPPPVDKWWQTEKGIEAKGQEIGIQSKPGESWASFKDRLFIALKQKA